MQRWIIKNKLSNSQNSILQKWLTKNGLSDV